MAKKRYFTIVSYIIPIIIVIVLTLIWQARRIERQMREIESVPEVTPTYQKEERFTTGLVPSQPEDYGMIVTNEFNKPATQAEWNELLHKKLAELKKDITPQTLEKVRDKIKEDPEKRRDKLAKIDRGIQDCRQILKEDPENKSVHEKLERLLILKSLYEGLEDF